MNIEEETDELLFVQHVTAILDVPNSRPDLAPGGLWVRGIIRLSWGLRAATEPPTLQIGRSSANLNGTAPALPYDLHARLAVWQATWRNRATSNFREMNDLDFRDTVAITAILGWTPPTPDDEPC